MSIIALKESKIQPDSNLYLKASGAETADTAQTALAVGPFLNGKVSVVCTAGFATGTLLLFIEQSDTLGGTFTDDQLAESPVIAGASANAGKVIWETPIYATKLYVRVRSTHESSTGAVSKTYQVILDLGNVC
jgi:hypothetical protein